jgi:hypothetical protein
MRRLGPEVPQDRQGTTRAHRAHRSPQEDGHQAKAIIEGHGEIEDLLDPAEEGAPDTLQTAIHRANIIGRMRTEARHREEQTGRVQVVPWHVQPTVQNHQEALRRANEIGSHHVVARRLERKREQIRAAQHRTRGLELPAKSEQNTWHRRRVWITMWVHDQRLWQGDIEGGLTQVDVELPFEVLLLLQLPPRRDKGSVPMDPESVMPPT